MLLHDDAARRVLSVVRAAVSERQALAADLAELLHELAVRGVEPRNIPCDAVVVNVGSREGDRQARR